MSMTDSRDRTSYWINNTVKKSPPRKWMPAKPFKQKKKWALHLSDHRPERQYFS